MNSLTPTSGPCLRSRASSSEALLRFCCVGSNRVPRLRKFEGLAISARGLKSPGSGAQATRRRSCRAEL